MKKIFKKLRNNVTYFGFKNKRPVYCFNTNQGPRKTEIECWARKALVDHSFRSYLYMFS